MCHFRSLWNGLCDRRRAEITVMQFTGHSLPVHHWSGTFTLSHIISRAHLRDFFRLLAIGMCHFRYLVNGRCDHHRAEITIMQFIGQSLPMHHFFYGTVRIFTLSHIVSQAVFYTPRHLIFQNVHSWTFLVNPSPLSPLHTNEAIVQQRLAKVEKITKAYDTQKNPKTQTVVFVLYVLPIISSTIRYLCCCFFFFFFF